MKITLITLFPEYFTQALTCSLMGRAVSQGILSFDLINLREYGEGKYRAVDDRPFGGGPGMVLMAPVLEAALQAALGNNPVGDCYKTQVVLLSPQGDLLTSAGARTLSKISNLILICGHYEGVDERFVSEYVDQTLSIGDYILTGGEPAALVVVDAISRFLPGVVGEPTSVTTDTFGESAEMVPGGLKAPQFTRPAVWRGQAVPEVLLSGNHGAISKWRLGQSVDRTAAWRASRGQKK